MLLGALSREVSFRGRSTSLWYEDQTGLTSNVCDISRQNVFFCGFRYGK